MHFSILSEVIHTERDKGYIVSHLGIAALTPSGEYMTSSNHGNQESGKGQFGEGMKGALERSIG